MQKANNTRGAAVVRRTTRAASEIPAPKTVKKVLTTAAPRAYSKPTKPCTDSDDDSDYSSTCSDNSEEYRPLAFGLIKGGPTRRTGAIHQSHYSMRISQDAASDDMSLSDDEVPLAVTYENGAAKRKCGRIDDAAPTAKTMYGAANDVSSDSDCLPVGYLAGKRPRRAGRGANINGPEATMEEAEIESVDPDDETPLNTKLILNLVRRIRMNPKEITLEAFAYVDWGDENYQEELKPLRRLYEELEAKARYVEQVKTAPQRTKKVDYDARIKEAIMALPQESAIIAKSQKLKSQQLRARPGAILRGDKTSTFTGAGVEPSTGQQARGKNQVVSTKPSKGQRQREKRLEASFGELEKLEGSALLARQPAKGKIKESTMSEAAKKVRRAARQANRSATFADVVADVGDEIVEDQAANELPTTSRAQSSLGAPLSRVGDRGVETNGQTDKAPKPRKSKRREKGRDPGRSVSFADLPEDEAGEMTDGPSGLAQGAKRKRRVAGKRANNRSCSFADVVVDAGDEVHEDNTGPRSKNEQDSAEKPTSKKRTNHKQHQRTGLGRSRELSISCLDDVEAGEIHESTDDLAFLNRQSREIYTSATPSVRASRTSRAPSTVRRSSVTSQRAPIPVSQSMPDDVGDQVVLDAPGPVSAKRTGRSRKQRKHVSQELSISALPDDNVGEICEQHTEFLANRGGAGPATRSSLPRVAGAAQRSSVVSSVPTVRGTRAKDAISTGPNSVRTSANGVRRSK